MARSFESARLKIERANKHIQDLHQSMQAITHKQSYIPAIQHNSETGEYQLKITGAQVVVDWSLALGDVVHNLRTALDHVVWELVATITKQTPSKWVRFPFQKTRPELVGTINRGEIKSIGTDLIDLIVDEIKPYDGGNDPLVALHRMDIMDKHHSLISVISQMDFDGLVIALMKSGEIRTLPVRMMGEQDYIALATAAEFKLADHGNTTFQVLFKEGGAFKDKPVIPTLHNMSQVVSSIVDVIEKAYLTGGSCS